MEFLTFALAISTVVVNGVAALSTDEAVSTLTSTGSCCSSLEAQIPGTVFFSNDTTSYDAAVEPYWSTQAGDVKPICAFKPNSTEDVSTAVKILNEAYKISMPGCQFAIRSGGHTPWAGANNIEGGITFDLQNLNVVEPSEDRTQVAVGPGNRWSDVYSVLDPQNLAIVGGRSFTVGVGGLLLSGGLSFFTPRYGMPCDNIINYEVVLSSGEIVNANISSNPDLFIALKGGSNNFGVVTRFDLRSFDQGEFWGGVANFNFSELSQQFKNFEAFAKTDNYDPFAQLTVLYVWAGNLTLSMNHMHYTNPDPTPFPAVFKNFTDIPRISDTFRVASVANFTYELKSLGEEKRLFATATYGNSAAMMQSFFDLMSEAQSKLKSFSSDISIVVSTQPFPELYRSKAAENGGNSLGLATDNRDLTIVDVSLTWTESTNDEAIYAEVRTLLEAASAKATELGVDSKYIFMNYAAEWQDPISGYGEETVAELRATSLKYDPAQLFQNAVPGGYKLGITNAVTGGY